MLFFLGGMALMILWGVWYVAYRREGTVWLVAMVVAWFGLVLVRGMMIGQLGDFRWLIDRI